MKRIASIQDVSCLGRCSQTVALPVVSAMGVECAILPTAVLSTHTSFPDFHCLDLTDQLLPVARHWKAQGVRFDALYTGYLASDRQVAVVLELLELLREEGTLLFVDPAMADHGKLYAGFGPEFPALMAQVVSKAQITVPNITEASLMTGLPYREDYDEAYVKALLRGVAALGAEKVVLTGVSLEKDTIGFMSVSYTPLLQPPGASRLPRHGGYFLRHGGGRHHAGHEPEGRIPSGGGFHPAVHRSDPHRPPGGMVRRRIRAGAAHADRACEGAGAVNTLRTKNVYV